MGFYRCVPTQSGGGGGMTETPLWTNTSPTDLFESVTVNLSDSINNYDLIKIKYKRNAGGTTDDIMISMYVKPSDLAKSTSASLAPLVCFGATVNSSQYFRYIIYSSATSLIFTNAYLRNASSTNGWYATPLEICGCK